MLFGISVSDSLMFDQRVALTEHVTGPRGE
jgi:hypothetical protein